jgi:hypothetical protein
MKTLITDSPVEFALVAAWRMCCRENGIPEELAKDALPTFASANALEDTGCYMDPVWEAFEPHAARIREAGEQATQAKRAVVGENTQLSPDEVCIGEWDPSLAVKVGGVLYPKYLVMWGTPEGNGTLSDISPMSAEGHKVYRLKGTRVPAKIEILPMVAEVLEFGTSRDHARLQAGKPGHIVHLAGGKIIIMESLIAALSFYAGDKMEDVGRYAQVSPL